MKGSINISIPSKYQPVIESLKDTGVCVSRLVLELLLKYIETKNPEMLAQTKLLPHAEPSLDECKWFLAEEFKRRGKGIGHNVLASVIAKGLGTTQKFAEDRAKSILSAPSEFDLNESGGFIIPTQKLGQEYRMRKGIENAIREGN